MPKYLPRTELPPVIYEALVERTYQIELQKYFNSLPEKSRKLKKYSVTTLSRSPRERILRERHDSEIVEDPVKDRFWSMLGSLIHLLLEKRKKERPEDLVEQRLGWDVGPFPDGSYMHLHGQPDLFNGSDDALMDPITGDLLAFTPANTITDYKVTSAWSLVNGQKHAYHAQLNINKWLIEQHGYPSARKLQNIFLFKDWRKADADKIPNYPQDKILPVEIPIWDTDKTVSFFMDRMWKHGSVEHLPDDDLPFCTPEERWQTLPEYKVYKLKEDGSLVKGAKFKSPSKIEAEEWAEEAQSTEWQKIVADNEKKKRAKKPENELTKPRFIVKEIPAKPEFCFLCKARPWCNQYRMDVANGIIKEQQEEQIEDNE